MTRQTPNQRAIGSKLLKKSHLASWHQDYDQWDEGSSTYHVNYRQLKQSASRSTAPTSRVSTSYPRSSYGSKLCFRLTVNHLESLVINAGIISTCAPFTTAILNNEENFQHSLFSPYRCFTSSPKPLKASHISHYMVSEIYAVTLLILSLQAPSITLGITYISLVGIFEIYAITLCYGSVHHREFL